MRDRRPELYTPCAPAVTAASPTRACAAFVFDLDGTLLDTEQLSDRAMDNFFGARFGAGAPKMSWELKQRIIGKRAAEWAPLVLGAHGVADRCSPQELAAGWESSFKALYPLAEKLPGVAALVAALGAGGAGGEAGGRLARLPCAIATSSSSDAVALKRLNHEDLFGRMGAIVTGDMVSRGKPAPDIFAAAARELGVRAEACLAFEDTIAGVRSAVAAGMRVVAIPDPRMAHGPFFDAGATRVLSSLAEFDPAEWVGQEQL